MIKFKGVKSGLYYKEERKKYKPNSTFSRPSWKD